MTPLQQKMAEFGFESNDHYDYHVRCLLKSDNNSIRCMNVEGDSDRRMTAFANALAYALNYPHILYYDFTETEPPPPVQAESPDRAKGQDDDSVISPLERTVSEACAFSEGENTILIIDQLQAADFKDHIRLYQFMKTAQWKMGDAAFVASRKNLLVFLISEKPLYHSLQKISFKVWVNKASKRAVDYQPQDFGLGDEAIDIMANLAIVFNALKLTPTQSEYQKILTDLQRHIRHIEALQHAIYGWTEGIDRKLLYTETLHPLLQNVINSVEQLVGLDEVELTEIPE
ncbi:MAG: hypothetical protein HOM11_04610 [Methylococcales bacterium]|jgi:hypothetical protein|nr:hypothetical protein [Methylococcales bacterium]MBT7443785.1 hypothetical protein [Methylococcales bacterium]